MKLKDAKQIVKLLSDEWDLGKKASGGKKNVCAWIYFCDIMAESEKIVVERKNGKIIGMCGYAKWNSKKHLVRKKFYAILEKILLNSHLIENKQGMIKYLEGYDYTPQELRDHFDGEISIIIIDKEYRNLGLGKKMILKIFDYAKNDNVKRLQILSDESCNYKFYESIGCKKVCEKIISNGETNKCGNSAFAVGFIYEKELEV